MLPRSFGDTNFTMYYGITLTNLPHTLILATPSLIGIINALSVLSSLGPQSISQICNGAYRSTSTTSALIKILLLKEVGYFIFKNNKIG